MRKSESHDDTPSTTRLQSTGAESTSADTAVADVSAVSEPLPEPSDFPARPFLSTRRLRLRELCLADIPALQAMNGDARVGAHLVEPCVTDYFGVARTIFQANAYYVTRPGLGVWHASDADGQFVGVFALMPIEGTDDVEIGTRLLPQTRGRLLPIEGGRALCTHAFDTVGLPRLVGLCHPDNTPVPSILRRLGFSAAGETLHFGNRALRFILDRDTWHARLARMRGAAPQDNPDED